MMVERKNMCLHAGDKAPDFIIKDQHEQPFQLSSFTGKRILLSFHPLAWTSVCAKQMQSLEKNAVTFDSLHTVAVGVSVDTVPSLGLLLGHGQ